MRVVETPDPVLDRLNQLVSQKASRFSEDERSLIERATKFGASEKQQKWIDKILERVEPEDKRKQRSRQDTWTSASAECEMCCGEGFVPMRKPFADGDRSCLFVGKVEVDPALEFREVAEYCAACERGVLLQAWNGGKRNALDVVDLGWRSKEAWDRDHQEHGATT